MRKFLDTSAVVKLHVAEPDTPVVQAEIAPCSELIISRLTLLEFRSAMYRMVREGRLTSANASAALGMFAGSLAGYTILPVDESVWQRAEQLLDAHAVADSLRPPDAVQLASAFEEHARRPLDAIVTIDATQRLIAQAHGLVVVP